MDLYGVDTVAILCGGRGTRLQGNARELPKPLVEIGGRPILWHVVRIYAAQGVRRFVLLTGYRGEEIAAFTAAEPWPDGVEVTCVDTGVDTPTGGRLARVSDRLAAAGTFLATYADGVADIDLHALIAEHRAGGALGTITVVRPELPFGVAELTADGRVQGFHEKPRSEQWINGGFFCFEPGMLAYLDEASVLEIGPFDRLAAAGRLRAYRHTGFWDCMDTYKDAAMLNDLWAGGKAPWNLWD